MTPLSGSKGFTLMEVLVASAVAGIAIGAILAILAQGHRQAFRGDMSQKAAVIAARLIGAWESVQDYPSAEDGRIEDLEGWSYSVESGPVSTKIVLPGGDIRNIDRDDLTELRLEIIPPGKNRHFVLTMWVPKSQVEH